MSAVVRNCRGFITKIIEIVLDFFEGTADYATEDYDMLRSNYKMKTPEVGRLDCSPCAYHTSPTGYGVNVGSEPAYSSGGKSQWGGVLPNLPAPQNIGSLLSTAGVVLSRGHAGYFAITTPTIDGEPHANERRLEGLRTVAF